MRKKTITTSILLLALYSCKQDGNLERATPAQPCVITPELKTKLTFDTVRVKNLTTQADLTGNVSFDLDKIFRYQSLFSGVVQKIYFNIGDYVHKGQVLAEIKSPGLSDQANQLFTAQSELKTAEQYLTSIKQMHESQLASNREVLEAEKKVSQLRSEMKKINESLHIHGGNIDRGVILIKAPQSGYIVQKNLTSGTFINEGDQDLFAISDLKKIWVMVNVYTTQLNSVRQGERAIIHTTAYPDQEFEGVISRLSNVFDPEEKVMKAIIELENDNLKLKPDMMVSVSVFNDSKQEALAVPISNVIFDNDAYHVILYNDDCHVLSVPIEPIDKDRNYYYLPKTSTKLKADDVLIAQNNLLLYNKLIGR